MLQLPMVPLGEQRSTSFPGKSCDENRVFSSHLRALFMTPDPPDPSETVVGEELFLYVFQADCELNDHIWFRKGLLLSFSFKALD